MSIYYSHNCTVQIYYVYYEYSKYEKSFAPISLSMNLFGYLNQKKKIINNILSIYICVFYRKIYISFLKGIHFEICSKLGLALPEIYGNGNTLGNSQRVTWTGSCPFGVPTKKKLYVFLYVVFFNNRYLLYN